MLRADMWGRGFATEAVGAFLEGALAQFSDLSAIEADVYDDNPASWRVLDKLGFRRVGPASCSGVGRGAPAPSSLFRASRAAILARVPKDVP